MTEEEGTLRRIANGEIHDDPEDDCAPCPPQEGCQHPDCHVANALKAMLDKGNERFANWRIHRNDSPQLGQEMWREVIEAGFLASGGGRD